MRIAMLQHTFNPTTIGWVRGLEARGHEVVTVIADASEPYGGWPDDLQVRLVPDSDGILARVARGLLPGRKGAVSALPRVREMRRTLMDLDPDAVIVKLYSLRNVIALLIALMLRIPRVAWIEQTAPPNLEWRVLRHVGLVPRALFVTNDRRPGGLAEPLDPPDGGFPVITYAPVIPGPSKRATLNGRPLRILTVASFWDAPVKRPFWTLEAAREAALLDGTCTFTFVGVGKRPGTPGDPRKHVSQQRISELTEELNIQHLVEVRVNIPYREMPAFYAGHDLLVLPSFREQFGMVVPEAMAHGLAVVASDRVGSRGCIVPGVTGQLFVTDDRDDLARVLRELAGDPETIARMGREGRAFVERHASPDRTAGMLEALIGR